MHTVQNHFCHFSIANFLLQALTKYHFQPTNFVFSLLGGGTSVGPPTAVVDRAERFKTEVQHSIAHLHCILVNGSKHTNIHNHINALTLLLSVVLFEKVIPAEFTVT